MSRSRIFAAWKVPEPAAGALHEFGAGLAGSLQTGGARVSREARNKLHATLHFLGDVDDVIVPALGDALRSVAEAHSRFDVRFDGAGCFPATRRPRVVFASIGEGGPALVALAERVQAALVAAGAPPPDKPFHAHVTLVRVKERPRSGWRPDPLRARVEARVESIALYKSVLGRGGATHTVIASGALL